MWDNKYEPPASIFDEIEPAACTIFIIALFAIIAFTPLSPFSGRDQSALDQFAGVNSPVTQAHVAGRNPAAANVEQVEAASETPSVIR